MRTYEQIVGDVDMIRKAKAIREWLLELSGLIPRLNESPNPYYGSTVDGLALIHYYGGPSAIATPYGEWMCTGGGCLKNLNWFEEARDRLGLVEVVAGVQLDEGYFGPVHAITKDLDGNPLPECVWETRGLGTPGIRSESLFSAKTFPKLSDAVEHANKLGVVSDLWPDFKFKPEVPEEHAIRLVGTEISHHEWARIKTEIGYRDWWDERPAA